MSEGRITSVTTHQLAPGLKAVRIMTEGLPDTFVVVRDGVVVGKLTIDEWLAALREAKMLCQ